jgi:hypothetical protein
MTFKRMCWMPAPTSIHERVNGMLSIQLLAESNQRLERIRPGKVVGGF